MYCDHRVQRLANQVQFHQHFMPTFLYKCFVQFFSYYSLALNFFGKRISVQNLLVKCWWNWPQLVSPLADVVGDIKRIGLSVVLSSIARHRTNDLPFCGSFISQVIYLDHLSVVAIDYQVVPLFYRTFGCPEQLKWSQISFYRFSFRTNNTQNIVVLLHPSEH